MSASSTACNELNKAMNAVLEMTAGYFLVSFPCSSIQNENVMQFTSSNAEPSIHLPLLLVVVVVMCSCAEDV